MAGSLRNKLKVALVHDWLVSEGGAEQVLKCFHEVYPDAPIYTLVYNREKAPAWTHGLDIRTTHIQNWPGGKTHHKFLLTFMPKAWEALDLTEYDLVLSSCASCCKGVITRPDAVHVCYCHSPIRYVWDLYYDYLRGASRLKRAFMPSMIHKVRMWDFQAAQRVDYFVSNSDYVGKRIGKFYRRESQTIYPGINLPEGPVSEERGDYYFVLSRFVGYKRIDIAIEACNKLGRKLIVAGSGGEEEAKLRAMAGPMVEFVGRVSDEQLLDYCAHAKAFLFPGVEDFGLTPLEAMAGGTPVLAYGEGGALETVVDGETGMFFHEQSADSLARCIQEFEGRSFSAAACRARAEQFSTDAFKTRIKAFCDNALAKPRGGR
ncbi:glycosyltransferase [Paratractidigestivibacter sp.]|uniref:glycosyltransferase n=1 Tax=Paratractidigestivibacter sp. TaxID=2847316 RepID=UPI002ACB0FC5|nr:glycosyltransferase [Paratractidigestivibacter sp.]